MLGFKIWKVCGESMSPRIPELSYVLVTSWLRFLPIREGQTLLLKHKLHGYIVKNVAMVDKIGLIWSKGENEKSLSVEELGPVSKDQIMGRVISIIKK